MTSVPDPSYFIALPTIRTRPDWYVPMHPELSDLISKCLRNVLPSPRPLRAFLMSGRDLDSDGIHLNAISGMAYVQFLVNQPR